jgi:predicted enzyme related to lactoylglutathione lyase
MREIAAGAVVYAKDLRRVAAFYEHAIGLKVELREPTFVQLGCAGFELVVHAIPADIAASITLTDPPQRREDSAVKLVLPVSSIAAARAAAALYGGTIDAPECEWEFNGAHLCDGHDPEGNVIQVREAA